MHEQQPPPNSPESRSIRALPYVVALVFALGFLVFNTRTGGSGEGSTGGTSAESAGAEQATDVVPAVRRALGDPAFTGVAVGGSRGSIVLSGEVADEQTHAAALAAANAVAGVASIDDRIVVAGTATAGASATTDLSAATAASSIAVPATTGVPVARTTASTVAPTTAPVTAAPVTEPASTAPAATEPPTTAPDALPDTTGPTPPTPAAVVPDAATIDQQLSSLLLGAPVQFEVRSARIESGSYATLDQAAAIISTNPSLKFEIQGHTDSGGQASWNLSLSQSRAEAVRAYLIKRGVPADHLTAVGFGETKPIARNATPEGRAKNRRVEIVAT